MKPLLAAAFLSLAFTTAHAWAFEHPETGFAVDLPEEFIVDPGIAQMADYDILVGINPASGEPAPADLSPFVCQAGFQGSDGNAGLRQKEINAMASGNNDWTRRIISAFEMIMRIDAYENFNLLGVTGIQLITTPKIGTNAEDTRIVFSIMETPRGRTMLVCTATREGIWRALPVFQRIRGGIIPPR